MANIEKIIKSKNQPKQTNVAWVDLSGETPVEKHFINGRWISVGGIGGSSIVINPDEEATETLSKIKADGTVYDANISGKADKEVTPTIITPSVDGTIANLTTEEIESLRIGDIVKTTDVINGQSKQRDWEVASITQNKIVLTYTDNYYISGCIFNKSGNNWNEIIVDPIINFLDIPKKTYVNNVRPAGGMLSNTLYNLGELSGGVTQTFALAAATDNTIANVWMWTFSTGDTAPTITWPAEITMWSSGDASDIEANKYYEVSVMNGVCTVISADIPQEEETEVEP